MLNKFIKIEHFKNNQKGFTLIELLVVISIIGIISSTVLSFIVMGFKATRFESEQAEAVSTARNAMIVMKKEIRGANNSEQGGYPINLIDDQDFIFFADIDNDNSYEKVRYYKDNLNLVKEVTEAGALKDYSGTPASTTVAKYVNNQEEIIFTFYDSDHIETGAINEIRLININLKINITPTIAPNDIYIETDVTFRNLKTNL